MEIGRILRLIDNEIESREIASQIKELKNMSKDELKAYREAILKKMREKPKWD